MREQIDTIPVNEAFEAQDECPFCWLERKAEQSTIRYVAGPGASYMEPDVRGATDRAGFCTAHMKKLYDYGNSLGEALILQTYYAGLLEEFHREAEAFSRQGTKPLGLFRKKSDPENGYSQVLRARVESCFICDRIRYHMDRYYMTFFHMLREEEFRRRVESGKGFCLKHFGMLLEHAQTQLPSNQRQWFQDTIFRLEEENLIRVKQDLDWFIAKFDYRNAGADWKNSKDALSRTMQKLQGFYPNDPPYKKD